MNHIRKPTGVRLSDAELVRLRSAAAVYTYKPYEWGDWTRTGVEVTRFIRESALAAADKLLAKKAPAAADRSTASPAASSSSSTRSTRSTKASRRRSTRAAAARKKAVRK